MTDHSEVIAAVAGRIANKLIKGEMVKHGNSTMNFYKMRDVEEFISCDSDLCEARRELLVQQMEAVFRSEFGEVDALREVRTHLVDFYYEAVGLFAESVATKVFNYEVDQNADCSV